MINYIGQFKREKINTVIRAAIRRNKNIYTFLLSLILIIPLLFYKGLIKAPEKISGDKKATALLLGKSKCTAFLVSEKGLLLTSRHCVDVDEVVSISFTKIQNKEGKADSRFQKLKAKVIYFPEDDNDPNNIANDYAVLKLVNKLPDSPKVKPLEVAGEIKNPQDYTPEVIIIGYPGDDMTQSYDQKNAVRNYSGYQRGKIFDKTLFQTGRTYEGMSGGPVIDKKTGKVIGIVTRGYEGGKYSGISGHEKIQQVFNDPNASHIDW